MFTTVFPEYYYSYYYVLQPTPEDTYPCFNFLTVHTTTRKRGTKVNYLRQAFPKPFKPGNPSPTQTLKQKVKKAYLYPLKYL